jgi:hypothetical protein
MNCCNDFGVCDHGPGCPTGAATMPPVLPVPLAKAARTCEALGVCQHPERECRGACEQRPRVPASDALSPSDPTVQDWRIEDLGRDNLVTAVLIFATIGATLGVLYGAGRWVWAVLA